MKNHKIIPICVVLALIMSVGSALSCAADSFTYYKGYKVRTISNTTAALSGWYEKSEVLSVPARVLLKSIITIDSYSFYYDSDLTAVDFSGASNLVSIGEGAFMGCSNLTEVSISANVRYLSSSLFESCTSLEKAELNCEISKIDRQLFYGCSSLTEVSIPSTVEEIDHFAFGNCTSLGLLVVPRSVTQIQSTSFSGCNNLTLAVWSDSYALEYAVENEIPFVLLDGLLSGDVNGDQLVDVRDVTAIQRCAADFEELNVVQRLTADVDRTGAVTIEDATVLQGFLVDFETDLPIGEFLTDFT